MQLEKFNRELKPQPKFRNEKREVSKCKVTLENGKEFELAKNASHKWFIKMDGDNQEIQGFATWPSLPAGKDIMAPYMTTSYEIRKDPQSGRYIVLKDPDLGKRLIGSKIVRIE